MMKAFRWVLDFFLVAIFLWSAGESWILFFQTGMVGALIGGMFWVSVALFQASAVVVKRWDINPMIVVLTSTLLMALVVGISLVEIIVWSGHPDLRTPNISLWVYYFFLVIGVGYTALMVQTHSQTQKILRRLAEEEQEIITQQRRHEVLLAVMRGEYHRWRT